MRFCIVGSGAVGGYFGAKLVRAGRDVTFLARGAHLDAMRRRGLSIRSPLGDFTVPVCAEERPEHVGAVDVALFAVKNYSNREALPLLRAVVDGGGSQAVALTLQNGVDSVDDLVATIGVERVLGGTTYVATALAAAGVIEQTGDHRRIVFGEIAGEPPRVTARVQRIHEAFTGADIVSEPVADARVAIWEKFCYLAPFAAFTGAARLPIGPLWAEPIGREMIGTAVREVAAVARAEGVAIDDGLAERVSRYMESIPGATRSSLLIDLQQGKPIEIEALAGAVVRRARSHGVATPVMAALYAVLKPHASVTR